VDGVTLALLGILELVGLDVGAEGLGDISGRHLGAISMTEERGKLLLERDGGLEDGGALGSLTLRTLSLALTAAATASLLEVTRNTLVELLESLDTSNSGVTDRLELGNKGINVLLKGRGGASRGSLNSRRLRGRGGNRSRCRGSLFLLGLDLLYRGGNRGRSGLRGGILLGNFLRGFGGGGAHRTSTGDI
jgi:hypothetical protein